jgi:CBS domain-containing protein
MVFAVYEQGMRIQTPRKSLLGRRGVNALEKISAGTRVVNNESDTSHLERVAEQPFEQMQRQISKNRQANDEESLTPTPRDLSQKALNAYNSTKKVAIGKRPKVSAQMIMSRPVVTADFDTSIQEGWQLLQKRGVSHLILQNRRGALLGMITDKDILKATSGVGNIDLADRSPDQVMLGTLVSRKLLTVNPDTEVLDLASVMHEQNLSALPVVTDNDELLGLITRTDVLQAVVSHHLEIWY